MEATERGEMLRDFTARLAIVGTVGAIVLTLVGGGVWLAYGQFGLQVAIVIALMAAVALFVFLCIRIALGMFVVAYRSMRSMLGVATQLHADVAATYTDIVTNDDDRDIKLLREVSRIQVEQLRTQREREKQELERIKTGEHAIRQEQRLRIAQEAQKRKALEASAIDGEFYGQLPQVSGLKLPEIN